MFSRAFVIQSGVQSLGVTRLNSVFPACCGITEAWQGIDGTVVRHPKWWTAGDTAWGAYRTHLGLLEYCYNAGVESYIVVGEGVRCLPAFEELWSKYAPSLPDDWEQIYLGGNIAPGSTYELFPANDNWLVPFRVSQVSCYALHRRGYAKLYRYLHGIPCSPTESFEGLLGRLCEAEAIRAYVPVKWLVRAKGSDRSELDPGCRLAKDGNLDAGACPQDLGIPRVLLDAPPDVAVELENLGWRQGRGLELASLKSNTPRETQLSDFASGLESQFDSILEQGIADGARCLCVRQSRLTEYQADLLAFTPILQIRASTAQQAEQALSQAEQSKANPFRTRPTRNLICLISSHVGVEKLRFALSQISQRINAFDGFRALCLLSDDCDQLQAVIDHVQGWHIDFWWHGLGRPVEDVKGRVVLQIFDQLPRNDSVTFYTEVTDCNGPQGASLKFEMAQFQLAFENWSCIRRLLERNSVVGTFPTRESSFRAETGSYPSRPCFWFRNEDVFLRPNWMALDFNNLGSAIRESDFRCGT